MTITIVMITVMISKMTSVMIIAQKKCLHLSAISSGELIALNKEDKNDDDGDDKIFHHVKYYQEKITILKLKCKTKSCINEGKAYKSVERLEIKIHVVNNRTIIDLIKSF